jgi:LAO/AO transport system kinase
MWIINTLLNPHVGTRVYKRAFSAINTLTDKNRLLANGLLAGDRSSLARAITLIESSRPDHQIQSDHFINYLAQKCPNKRAFQNGKTFRLGIAGPPGGGKVSGFILFY